VRLGYPCLCMDIRHSALFDLTHPTVSRTILMWIKVGRVAGVWLAPPCTSWSAACRPAVRSRSYLFGLPSVPAHRAESLKTGNDTHHFVIKIVSLCVRLRVPCAVENPDTSLFWLTPQMQHHLRRSAVYRFCFCAFGTKWRKATKVAAWNLAIPGLADKMCTKGKGVCQYSGRRHTVLKGRDPVSGRNKTSLAAAYPHRFASVVAAAFVDQFRDPVTTTSTLIRTAKPV